MTTLLRRMIVPVLAICLVQAIAVAQLDHLRAFMQQQVDDGNVVGCAAQVTKGGETVFFEAFGNHEPGSDAPMRTDTILRIYSMTKAITSTAIMQLVEKGKLGIDDPVSQYIPEFGHMIVGVGENARPASRQITIRDLLTHTSGLAYDFSAPPSFKAAYANTFVDTTNLEQAAIAMAELPLVHDPGESFTYGLNTDVLGRVVEVVAGQTFGEYLGEHIFSPLGMTNTSFEPPADYPIMPIVTGMPGALEVDKAHYAKGRTEALKPGFESGGGGLWSTLHDYTRFMTAMERHGELDGVRILKPKTVAFMTQQHLSPAYESPQRFGLGFGLNAPVMTEYGPRGGGRWTWGGAASTFFFIDPKTDVTAVFVTQKFPFDAMLGAAFEKAVLTSVK